MPWEEETDYIASHAQECGQMFLGVYSRGSDDDAIYNSIKQHQIPRDKSRERCVRSL